jgi:hypothetical protein
MVEVEAAGISFPTINARMQFQVIQDPLALFPPDARGSLACFANVVMMVSLIVHSHLLARTGPTINLAQSPAFILEVKFRKSFFLAALPAHTGVHCSTPCGSPRASLPPDEHATV